jgi:signal transduction histidine kinase
MRSSRWSARGNRLLALLTEMLDTADIDAGKLQVEVVEFSPQNLLIGIKAHFQPMAAAKGLSLTLNLDPRVPQRLFGDPIRLGQVLRNLMGNAVKFSHEGEVVLRMGLVKLASGFADLLFEVEDSGVGIGLEAQQHLFELFEQEDASSTRCFEGADLVWRCASCLHSSWRGTLASTAARAKEVCSGSPCDYRSPHRRCVQMPMQPQTL